MEPGIGTYFFRFVVSFFDLPALLCHTRNCLEISFNLPGIGGTLEGCYIVTRYEAYLRRVLDFLGMPASDQN